MALFEISVPGYAAVPERVGVGVTFNVDDVPWTDIRGLPHSQGMRFAGSGAQAMRFYFPLTVPVFVGTGVPGTGQRLHISEVFVTFFVENTIPKSTVRVTHIYLHDRRQPLLGFPADPPMPELAGAPPGSAGLKEGPRRFADDTVLHRNFHVINPPRAFADGLGVSARVDFGVDGGVIGFTAAGVKLQTL